jgi:DNA-binding PadR family transcriptional regulator
VYWSIDVPSKVVDNPGSATVIHLIILGELSKGPRTGQELRESLRGVRAGTTLASFYQFIGRMEDHGLVHQERVKTEREDHYVAREAVYTLTPDGEDMLAVLKPVLMDALVVRKVRK